MKPEDGFRVLALQDADAWRDLWRHLPPAQRDVFGRPEYYAAFDGIDGAIAECAVFSSSQGTILYPYLRQPVHTLEWLELNEPYYDLIGAYGYGGPLGATADVAVWRQFAKGFAEHCRKTGVVAEFVRLHPLLGNRDALAGDYELELANLNVVVGLQREDGAIWRDYKHNNRKNINKALRNNVHIFQEDAPPEHFEEFVKIYHGTLDRRGARESYRFPPGFYEVLHKQMPEAVVYFFAELEGRVVSCELCLMSETTIYSFLGGTDEQFFDFRPNNLLKHELIKWARDRGLKYYLIGGGNKMSDTLFDYKRSFAPNGVVEFYVAKRIHDTECYSELLKRCEARFSRESERMHQWFLRWRFE